MSAPICGFEGCAALVELASGHCKRCGELVECRMECVILRAKLKACREYHAAATEALEELGGILV